MGFLQRLSDRNIRRTDWESWAWRTCCNCLASFDAATKPEDRAYLVGALESLAYVAPYPKDIRAVWSRMSDAFEEAKAIDRDSYESGLGAMAAHTRAKLESLEAVPRGVV